MIRVITLGPEHIAESARLGEYAVVLSIPGQPVTAVLKWSASWSTADEYCASVARLLGTQAVPFSENTTNAKLARLMAVKGDLAEALEAEWFDAELPKAAQPELHPEDLGVKSVYENTFVDARGLGTSTRIHRGADPYDLRQELRVHRDFESSVIRVLQRHKEGAFVSLTVSDLLQLWQGLHRISQCRTA